jgi:nitrous oxidase accessory protein
MTRILLTILSIFITCLAFGQRIEVCTSCAYTSIKKAIADSAPHDTIIVKKGVYNEHDIHINIPLTLIGVDKPTVDAQEKGAIFEIGADSVTLSGFIINNVERSHTKDYAAVHIYKSNHILLENNEFNNPFFAYLIEKSHNGIIRNNVINGNAVIEHNSGNGIHLWHCSNMEVLDNQVYQMRDGIYFEFVKSSKVARNISKHNIRYGLHFMFSNNDEYIENLFENNGAGVAVMFSKYIFMRKNTFKLNWGTASYGLLIKEIYDAEIKENIFEENTIGVNADGSNRVNFEENTFKNNGWAIKFHGACYSNKLKQNNFLNNSFGVAYQGSLNGNLFDKNFWSEYTGYDLDRDGIGDVPFRPIKLFSYVVNKTPETIILLRSLFVDIINFSEKVSPIFTPDQLVDEHPLMKPIQW